MGKGARGTWEKLKVHIHNQVKKLYIDDHQTPPKFQSKQNDQTIMVRNFMEI